MSARVVGRYRYEGTHTGNFLGYAATGNAFAMRSIDIWRVEDGRFIEHWDELNTLDIFIQVVPTLDFFTHYTRSAYIDIDLSFGARFYFN